MIIYSGHGVMCNNSYIVLNEKDADKRYFPLESRLVENLCYFKNVFGVGLFDCCREPLHQSVLDEIQQKA